MSNHAWEPARRAWLLLAVLAFAPLLAPAARADVIATTYQPAKQTVPDFAGAVCSRAGMSACYYGSENWTTWNGTNNYVSSFTDGGGNFTSAISITGTYTAGANTTTGVDWLKVNANQYGGQAGTDPYPELYGPTAASANDPTAAENSYSASFATKGLPGVNYFGIWISALDAHNDLRLYNTAGQLVLDFTPADLIKALGACPSSAYCGNPTAPFSGKDGNEQFAYVNFFDLTGYFGQVVLYDNGGTGFESSNHAVAYFDPNTPFGNALSVTGVPEPRGVATLGIGIVALALLRRRPARR